jgi:hypothetical protein
MQGLGMQLIFIAFAASVVGCFSGGSASLSGPLTSTIGSCAPTPCVRVSLSALPELPASLSPAAKTVILSDLKKALYASLDVESSEPSQDAIMRELQDRVDEYKSVSDADIDWSLTRTARLLHSDALITSVEVSSEGYLGGAHGFRERSLMTFDSRTGTRMGVTDVLGEGAFTTLTKIVEAEFRRARSIRSDQTLQDAGFFILPGQEIPVGENFAITDKGMEIQYNPYEIAPYSMGETRVRIPREAVEPLVKANLRGVFAGSVESATQH